MVVPRLVDRVDALDSFVYARQTPREDRAVGQDHGRRTRREGPVDGCPEVLSAKPPVVYVALSRFLSLGTASDVPCHLKRPLKETLRL